MKETTPIITGSVSDVQEILDSLPKTPNDVPHKNHKELLYRNVKKGQGFVEMYQSKDGETIGAIAIAVNPKFQKQGIGKSLAKGAIANMETFGLTRLEWYCKRSNAASEALAKSLGFLPEPRFSTKEWNTFYYGESLEESAIVHWNPVLNPSDVPGYYNETAMTSKKRKSLPDESFGLPRLRAYPLHDRNHVRQAIRMFGHCKDPKDREVLARNIFAAMERFGMDVKIGEGNALHAYAPKALREDSYLAMFPSRSGDEEKTPEEIAWERLRAKIACYNILFYGVELVQSYQSMSEFSFLSKFYPNLAIIPFPIRLRMVCGGLALPENAEIYRRLGMRHPLSTDFSEPIGWADSIPDGFELLVDSFYNADANWFRADLSDEKEDLFYCLRLYSLMGEILLNPEFSYERFTSEQKAFLADWQQRVGYWYDSFQESDTIRGYSRCAQAMYDLFWDFNDNPWMAGFTDAPSNAAAISVIRNMAKTTGFIASMNEGNESGELISRERCAAYLAKELGFSEDLYLLPGSMEYPILDKTSIRIAMDIIDRVPEEDREEFSRNLNRKYREFSCNFSIPVDHPYAPYADQPIVARMVRVLMEGNRAPVDDDGTSVGSPDRSEQPWYKRLDMANGINASLLDDRKAELGPNHRKERAEDKLELVQSVF